MRRLVRLAATLAVAVVATGPACADAVQIDNGGVRPGIGPQFHIPPGWDGPGLNPALDLRWFAGPGVTGLSQATFRDTYCRALMAWASVVDLGFTETLASNLPRSLDAYAGVGGHGDPFAPFGGELAHAYFPGTFGPNGEPVGLGLFFAGDTHVNDAFMWEVEDTPPAADGRFSLFYVLVHEVGHALGLGHSGNAADVMFPFVNSDQIFTGFGPGDLANIRELYSNTGIGFVSKVPEPTTLALCGLIGAGFVAYRVRRRKSVVA